MISIAQSRAARGLLNWTQQDLADASGLSKTAINNFEKGNSDIKSESLRAIQGAFDKAGIALVVNDGVQRKQDRSTILRGPHSMTELMHDILNTAHAPDDEILFLNADAHAPSQKEKNQVHFYADELTKAGMSKRILCAPNAPSLYGSIKETRWLPETTAQLITSHILYGDKTAMLVWQSDTIIIIQSKAINAAESARFEALWISGTPPAQDQKSTNHKNEKTGQA